MKKRQRKQSPITFYPRGERLDVTPLLKELGKRSSSSYPFNKSDFIRNAIAEKYAREFGEKEQSK